MMAASARNMQSLGASVSFVYLAQAGPSHGSRELRDWDGYPTVALSYIHTPNTFTSYLLPAWKARNLVKEFDTLFLVGVPQSGILFWPDGRAYSSWLATTVADEYAIRSWRNELHDRHWGWLLNRATMPVTRAFEREVLRRSSAVYALSKATQRGLIAEYELATSTHLPFPIDTRRFSPGSSPRQPAILYVGRVDDRRKNVGLLLHTFRRVLERVKNAELWLAGEYAPEGHVARLASDLGLGDTVKFLGARPNETLPDLYHRAAVFALPSRQEGLGIVVLEAMASGIPVVSTRCGGPEDDILDSNAGVLVEHDDPDEFANSLSAILEDRDRQRSMADNASRYIARAHSDQVFQETLLRGSGLR